MNRKDILILIVFLIVLVGGIYHYSSFTPPQSSTPDPRPAADFIEADVLKVIDGDTIEIENGKRIRYIGIDTPEVDEIFYEEAKSRNQELVGAKRVRLYLCDKESRDKYGRLLAWVYVDDVLINAVLLKEGFARVLIIPPCGKEKEYEFKNYENEATVKRLGLWASDAGAVVSAEEAGGYIGKKKTVSGKVINVFDSGRAVFLNFGRDYKTDFTVTIFHKDIDEFRRTGIDPVRFYKDKEVVVTGRIKEYNGPEIIIDNPSQIEVR